MTSFPSLVGSTQVQAANPEMTMDNAKPLTFIDKISH
jgi:hypothetical protein